MIFGMTHEQRIIANSEKAKPYIKGIRRFAYWPVELQDGRYVWLEPYWQYTMGTWSEDGGFRHYPKYEEGGGTHTINYLDQSDDYIALDFGYSFGVTKPTSEEQKARRDHLVELLYK